MQIHTVIIENLIVNLERLQYAIIHVAASFSGERGQNMFKVFHILFYLYICLCCDTIDLISLLNIYKITQN